LELACGRSLPRTQQNHPGPAAVSAKIK